MASNTRNPNHAVFSSLRPLRDRLMRAGYVLVSEERESESEYSGSTCCCSSCASSCSCEEYSDDDDGEEGDYESDDDEIVIEEAEVVEDEEEGYWSDCSACWARRRERERRSRMGRRFGNRYTNVASAAEGVSVQVHHHPFQREQHRGRNETPQRDRRNANHVTFRSTNSIISGGNDNAHSAAAETPSFRGLVDRIVSTTRQLRQGEQPVRHLSSWARVLEDLQRGANAAAASNTAANPTVAARAGRQSPSPRAANVSGDDGNGVREAQAQNQSQARPRRATGRRYFISGGRSTSVNRRRRLR